jgi:AraC-like DNA-binding protein
VRGRRGRLAGHWPWSIPRATDPGSARWLATGGRRRGAVADRLCHDADGHGLGLFLDRWRTIAGLGRDRGASWPDTDLRLWPAAACKNNRSLSLGAIQVPDQQLAEYGRALNGAPLVVPAVARWQPRPAAVRQLRSLHRAAIRMAEARAGALVDLQAAHGLEQQLLQALIECLSGRAEEETATGRRHRDILARFEELLIAEPFLGIARISAELGVSERSLRACCKEHLAMGPNRYRHLCAMQQVRPLCGAEIRTRRASRRSPSATASVISVVSPPTIGSYMANCRQPLCGAPRVRARRCLLWAVVCEILVTGLTQITGRAMVRVS